MQDKSASLYRMVTPEHTCPYGIKAKSLLEREGYEVDDHELDSKAAAEAFKKEHEVDTTPQAWIDGARIGGYEALRQHFGKHTGRDGWRRYQPVLAIFAVAFGVACALSMRAHDTVFVVRTIEDFVAIAMCLLAVQKLQNVESFSTSFVNYDLLARRYVPYSYVYPFAEAAAGVLMLTGALAWLAAPVAIFIGSIGAVSVFVAVFVEKREIRCACVGGDSDVPLGFVSLSENLMMLGMGLWMIIRAAVL